MRISTAPQSHNCCHLFILATEPAHSSFSKGDRFSLVCFHTPRQIRKLTPTSAPEPREPMPCLIPLPASAQATSQGLTFIFIHTARVEGL